MIKDIKKEIIKYALDISDLNKVLPNAEEITHENWVKTMEESCYGYQPVESIIAKGEYGNNILVIYGNPYLEEETSDLYLQWTYSYKGWLFTKYYQEVGVD